MKSRREFIRSASLYSAAFIGLRTLANQPLFGQEQMESVLLNRLGPLQEDVEGLMRVPQGFTRTIFSRAGEEMDDGLLVPGMHDGMAAFPGPDGRVLLVRNHELESAWLEHSPFGPNNERISRIPQSKLYDKGQGIRPCIGGTTTLVYNPETRELERHFLSLIGTQRNCAGGPTPWGTWVTCEEVNAEREPNEEQWHGYNFEVTPTAEVGLAHPVPLWGMGRFRHEAVAVDPVSGAVYQTEDLGDGLLYRYLPKVRGKLASGGSLQALAIRGRHQADTRNWPGTKPFPIGEPLEVEWIEMENVDSVDLDLRHRGRAKGAAVFARGEGAWWGDGEGYFAMTNGGQNTMGQIFKYTPSPDEGTPGEAIKPGTIELFAEPNNNELLSNADNLTIAPWGDVVFCEDTKGRCRVIGVTPTGEFYLIAENPVPDRELAGVCFSPDGETLFVNVQKPGFTVAINGPWPKVGA